MVSDTASTLDIAWDADGGTASFDGLVLDTRFADATGDPIDLAGTMTWTCRPS
jgi:hypothetical protein